MDSGDWLDKVILEASKLSGYRDIADGSDYCSGSAVFNSIYDLMEFLDVDTIDGLSDFLHTPGVKVAIEPGMVKLSLERMRK